MRSLVERHGPAEVWQRGLAVLGYPPTWALTGRELVTVRKALED